MMDEEVTDTAPTILVQQRDEEIDAPVAPAASETENGQEGIDNECVLVREEDYEEEYESSNPLENLIPMDKLKNGWGLIWSNITTTAQEINSSEAMNNLKSSVAPIWDETKHFFQKNTTVLAPAFEKAKTATVDTVQYSWEKTKEVSEAMRPHVEQAAQTFVDAAEKVINRHLQLKYIRAIMYNLKGSSCNSRRHSAHNKEDRRAYSPVYLCERGQGIYNINVTSRILYKGQRAVQLLLLRGGGGDGICSG